jgi:hypothetical protein
MNKWGRCVKMKIMERMEEWLSEIFLLNPTDDEMQSFVKYMEGKNWAYGVVSYNSYNGDQTPRIHDTYGQKWGGRCHIDMGFSCDDYSAHIMLGRHDAPLFIDYIKDLRAKTLL